MEFTKDTLVSDLAASAPSTIRVFQQYGIDFCCGGHRPLSDACAARHLDVDTVLASLNDAMTQPGDEADWRQAPLADLVGHIQTRFHERLRVEIPRLDAMIDKVMNQHGDRFPEMLAVVQRDFRHLRDELLAHMEKEDLILFPAVVALERGQPSTMGGWTWIDGPIEVMEDEHAHAGAALASLRTVTSDYTCPPGACATFQGLFHGLETLEKDMHVHIHLENNILFPRAAEQARQRM